ncbi:amidohydrolase [Sphingomonas koreensis]|uniref:amidohydrolase family protein n=1 Tax=Sphingomonas koreensis TaxID=93064 RepID=UPI000837A543|nr:amidohydrolase [Sphingomonas koreensis]PJI88110.1 imidazolonepropionase-like amidohydrolase [Sphingomonas koreensis]RSU59435.1 amidohydrolase [Sphingomonas koreensis]RSU66725.1 amidohydrolase [Sphingomonas koreensis]
MDLILRFALALWLAGLALVLPATAQPASRIAFVNANLVPMDRERVLRGQTVLVENGRIAAIGPRLVIPADARRIDARGLWLSPGLADLHTHVQTRDDLAIYLSYGVTTVLHMGEASNAFAGRTRIAANDGTIPAPHIYTALAVDGSPRYGHLVVTNAEEARAAVLLARANGYAFIKVYNTLSADAFAALTAAGQEFGIPLVGHTVTAMGGLDRQLAAGQLLVAHAEDFIYSHFFAPDFDSGQSVPSDGAIAGAVALVKRHDAFVTADLVTYGIIAQQWGKPAAVRAWLASPETRLLSPRYRLDWPNAGYDRRSGDLMPRAAFLGRLVKAFADADIPLVSGTDAPTIPGLFIGDSLHRNLALLESAGLTRYEALATATRNAGAFIARARAGEPPFGMIAPGARADLLLTRANPLDDLSTLRQPLGVMTHGVWHDRAALDALIAPIADRYAAR